MSAVATDHLIKPHGGVLVDRTGDAPADLDSLPVVQLTSRELSDLDMIASGALSPLEGFMGQADYESVLENMRLANGLPWSLPVCLAVDSAPQGDRVALADESGKLVAVLEVEGVYDYDKDREAELAYRTTDTEHPGVARLFEQKPMYLAGKVTVFERATPQFPELALDPADTRRVFAERGWKRVVGFQTRNRSSRARVPDEGRARDGRRAADPPARRRHEGRRHPAATRVACYEALVENYYPADRVLVSAFPARCATPGRARRSGTRSAARTTAARTSSSAATTRVSARTTAPTTRSLIFDEFEPHELDIEPMFFEHTFWCKVCGSMAEHEELSARRRSVALSGTKVREMLGNGEVPPVEFTRPEVAEVLIEAYKQ
jgi:sulfate adenylyltransferase